MLSEYDKAHIFEIVVGEQGDWYDAHVLRFLNTVLKKADGTNKAILYKAFPEECRAIYKYWGWSDDSIGTEFFYVDLWNGGNDD